MLRACLLLPLLGLAALSACQPAPEPPPEAVRVPVRSELVAAGPFRASLLVFGRVEPAARHPLLAPQSGRLRYPERFRQGLRTGATVTAGETLFVVENDILEHELKEAVLMERSAQAELERARRGVAAGFLPEVELRRREIDAQLAQERLDHTRRQSELLSTTAPLSGYLVVDERLAPGAEVKAGALVAELSAGGLQRVEGMAAASELELLRRGQEVRCLLPGGAAGRDQEAGDERLVGRGRVSEVAREVEASGAVRLVVEVTEDVGMPAAGEGLELRILLDARDHVLSVPEESLVRNGGSSAVFVLEASGDHYRAVRRVVQTGRTGNGRREVQAGLRPGERIATGGVEFLADGLLAVDTGAGEAVAGGGVDAAVATAAGSTGEP